MTMLMERFAPLFALQRTSTGSSHRVAPPYDPAADVLASEEEVLVHMDVPGLSADELEIELEIDVLTVRGERPFPYGGEGGDADGGYAWQLIARSFGNFERVLRVPTGLDPDAIEATIADGVLTVRIPKPETLKPRRIHVGGDASERREPRALLPDRLHASPVAPARLPGRPLSGATGAHPRPPTEGLLR